MPVTIPQTLAAMQAEHRIAPVARRMGIRLSTAKSIAIMHGIRVRNDRISQIRETIARTPILNTAEIARRTGCHKEFVRKVRRVPDAV